MVSTAAGIYIQEEKKAISWKLNPDHSVLAAELFAIKKALQIVTLNKYEKTVIFSDSKTSIQMIKRRDSGYRETVEEIQNLIHSAGQGREIMIQWVKAHSEIRGNEIADQAAKLGHESDWCEKFELHLEEHLSKLKQDYNKYIEERWRMNVEMSGNGTFLNKIRERIGSYPRIELKNRRVDVAINRLRMGHAGVQAYLARFGMADSKLCGTCHKIDTVEHYMLKCQKYRRERMELERELGKLGYSEISLKLVLGTMDSGNTRKVLQAVGKYLIATQQIEKL